MYFCQRSHISLQRTRSTIFFSSMGVFLESAQSASLKHTHSGVSKSLRLRSSRPLFRASRHAFRVKRSIPGTRSNGAEREMARAIKSEIKACRRRCLNGRRSPMPFRLSDSMALCVSSVRVYAVLLDAAEDHVDDEPGLHAGRSSLVGLTRLTDRPD